MNDISKEAREIARELLAGEYVAIGWDHVARAVRAREPSHELPNDTAVLNAIEKALARSAEGWRGMESAPRDGTEILAYSEQGGTGTMLVRHIALCDFLTDAEGDEYFKQGGSEEAYYEADWFAADFVQGERLSPDCYPTAWQPLPPPPSQQDSGAKP